MKHKEKSFPEKTCPTCGKKFTPRYTNNKKFCSKMCCHDFPVTKTCPGCGKEYVSKRGNSNKFCSDCGKHPQNRTLGKKAEDRKKKAKMKAIAESGMTYGQYMAHKGVKPEEPQVFQGTLRPTDSWMSGSGVIRIGRSETEPPPRAVIKRRVM